MGLAIAVVIALITLISVYIFGAKVWWMPPSISTHGPAVDHQFNLTLVVTGAVFVLAQLGLAYFVWKYRERGDGRKATYSHGNNALEVGWTSAAAIVFIGLNLIGYRIWANMYFTPAPPDALEIEVQGQATPQTVLDALETRYPVLRGTIRDQTTRQRRALVRFFACEQDLSLDPPDRPLPDAVVTGKEPFLIIGAMAGG